MKRQVSGLSETARDSRPEIPDGVFLVRVDGAQFRWHAHKPFYVLRLSVLQPRTLAGQSIGGRLYCTQKAMWKCGSWAGVCAISFMTQSFWPTNRSRRKASKTHRSTLSAAAALCRRGDAFSTLKLEASFEQQFNLLTQRPALIFRHLRQS